MMSFKASFKKAIAIRLHSDDPFNLVKYLPSHILRINNREEVLKTAERNINTGMSQHEYARLIKAAEQTKILHQILVSMNRNNSYLSSECVLEG